MAQSRPAAFRGQPRGAYYAIVDTILGQEWLNPVLLRFGASRVANSIISEVENSSVIYF